MVVLKVQVPLNAALEMEHNQNMIAAINHQRAI